MENDKLKSKKIETYAADMARAIESDEGGLIKKIIHEEEEHEANKINLSPKSKKNRLFMFISIALIILAFVVLIFLAFFYKEINTIPVTPQFTSIIFTEQTNFNVIDNLSKDQIVNTFLGQVNNTKVKTGGIDAIYLTENKKVIGFGRFISLIEGSLASNQINLISDNFLLGIFKNGTSSISPNIGEPFILLKVLSFSDIFPVMRNWENKILYDLHGFFGVNMTPETSYLFTKNWQDGIVANKNARILKDNNGKIVLMYVFADDSSIVITSSETATQEIILRLNSSKIKK